MVAQAGRNVVLKIGNGATPTESFVSLGGVRVSQMELEHAVQDASHADSGAWRALLSGGARKLRLVAEGVFEDSAAEENLRAVAFSGATRSMQLQFGNGDVVSGSFVVERYNRRGEVGGVEGFLVSLQSAGVISFVSG